MKAAVLKSYGGPEQFEVKDLEAPEIREGEILVRNRASSVNPVDTDVRQGRMKLMSGFTAGQVIGSDFSGTVVASKSDRFKEGDEVFGVLNAIKGGAYSELLAANEENAAIKPANISFSEAASLPMVSLTAWQGMVNDGRLKQGDKVLILGCSGGVGTAAVQIAKSFAAQVTGTCSGKHMDYAKSIGCDRVIDYNNDKVPADEKFDLIFDASGHYTITDYKNNLSADGMFVSTRGGTNDTAGAIQAVKDVTLEKRMKIVLEKPNTADLDKIRELTESGLLKPILSKVFSLEHTGEAHRFMESESPAGKVGIEIGSNENGTSSGYQKYNQTEAGNKSYVVELIATGLIAGMRSLSAPVVARKMILNISGNQLYSSRLRFLQSPAVSVALKVLAATEFLGDKVPGIPARTKPLSLGMRAASGAVSSASVAKKTRHNVYAGAVLGGVAAVVASYGMYYLRTRLSRKTRLPHFVLGIMEDAVVVAAGAALSQISKRRS